MRAQRMSTIQKRLCKAAVIVILTIGSMASRADESPDTLVKKSDEMRAPAESYSVRVVETVQGYMEGAGQADDITCVAVRFSGREGTTSAHRGAFREVGSMSDRRAFAIPCWGAEVESCGRF